MYAIYGNIYHQYTPFMLAYIPAPWILWVIYLNRKFMEYHDTSFNQWILEKNWAVTWPYMA